MAQLTQQWSGAGNIKRFQGILNILSDGEVKRVSARAINRVGYTTKTQVTRTLAKQTGLKQKIIRKAIGNPKTASPNNLEFIMRTRGGDIALKYFNPREVRGGLTASPFGKRTKFANHFITSGRVGHRFSSLRLKGHVFEANSAAKAWGRPIEGAIKSGVIIPAEMVDGETAQTFNATAGPAMERRMQHELGRLLL